MKSRVTKNLTAFVAFLLVSAIFTVFPVFASQPDMVFDPPNITFTTDNIYLGYRFNVTIWLHDSPPIAAWQIYCEFNDSFSAGYSLV